MTETTINVKRSIKKQVKCSWCDEFFEVNYINSKRDYSRKNNWGYWTEKEEDKDKYICSECLKKSYYQDYQNFLQQVTSSKKRQMIRTYLYQRIL